MFGVYLRHFKVTFRMLMHALQLQLLPGWAARTDCAHQTHYQSLMAAHILTTY